MEYRRLWHEGGMYFFTVNLLQRRNNDLLVQHINLLRAAIAKVKQQHPFVIHAWVVLPDHMHCVWRLPMGDDDYPDRWKAIKTAFSKMIPKTEKLSAARKAKGERGICD